MNSKKKLFQNSIIYFIGNFATKILAFFMLPLYTRYLAPGDYGEFDIAQSFTTLLFPIIFIQISDAVIRMLLEAKENEDRTKYVTNALAVLAVGTIVSLILLPFMTIVLNKNYLLLFYAYFILHAWHVVIQQIVRSIGYNKLYALGGIISTVTTVFLNLFFILKLNLKAESLFLSSIGASLAICLVMFFGAKIYRYISLSAISFSVFKEMARYCIPLIPNTLSWQMITTFSRLYLGGVYGSDAQGLFAVANRFPTLITMITSIFYLAWQEVGISVSNTDEKDDVYTDIYNLYIKALFAGTIVLMPLSKIYIKYFLGAEYSSIWNYIPVMLLSACISALTSFLGTAYLGKKDTKNIMYTSLGAGAINVLLVVLLTKRLGIWGVVIGGFCAYATLLLVRTINVKKIVTIKIDFKALVHIIFVFALFVISYYLLSGIIFEMILTGLSVVAAFVIMLPVLKGVLNSLKKK